MSEPTGEAMRCYRHADRDAYIRCQRCERLICPECMRDASVGFQCPSCVSEGAKTVRTPRTRAGATIGNGSIPVTWGLIGLNVLVFVLTDVLRLDQVKVDGAMTTLGIQQHEYWRLLTAAFLHFGPVHLVFNMLALYLFGSYLEQVLGTWRYAAAYVAAALTSSATVFLLSPDNALTAGASGAIAGLFAIALVLALRVGDDIRGFLVLIAINVFISTRDGVSWEGHLGGFVAGLVLGAAFAYAPRAQRGFWQAAAFGVLAVAVVAMIVLGPHDTTPVFIGMPR